MAREQEARPVPMLAKLVSYRIRDPGVRWATLRFLLFAAVLVLAGAAEAETPDEARYCQTLSQRTDATEQDREMCAAFSDFEEGRNKSAIRRLEPLAVRGVPDAQYLLGHMLFMGYGKMDIRRGRNLIESAAHAGSHDAQSTLVATNAVWETEEKNEIAVNWANKLKDAGIAYGYFFLGMAHQCGTGVSENSSLARGLLKEAIALGSRPAAFELGVLLEGGAGGPRDVPGAVELFKVGGRHGWPESLYALGIIFSSLAKIQSEEKKRDSLVVALTSLLLSADQGNLSAGRWLEKLREPSLDAPINEARKQADRWIFTHFGKPNSEFGVATRWCARNGISSNDCVGSAMKHHRACSSSRYSKYFSLPHEESAEYKNCRAQKWKNKE